MCNSPRVVCAYCEQFPYCVYTVKMSSLRVGSLQCSLYACTVKKDFYLRIFYTVCLLHFFPLCLSFLPFPACLHLSIRICLFPHALFCLPKPFFPVCLFILHFTTCLHLSILSAFSSCPFLPAYIFYIRLLFHPALTCLQSTAIFPAKTTY